MMELDVMQGNKTAMLYLPASEVQIDRALDNCTLRTARIRGTSPYRYLAAQHPADS